MFSRISRCGQCFWLNRSDATVVESKTNRLLYSLNNAKNSTYCSWHGFMYIRGWIQMVLAPNDLFSWNNNTMSTMLTRVFTLHLLSVMHVNTYSVHNRFLKPWWGRLLCFCSSRHVFSPSLARLNWRSLTPTRGPSPPTPKVASFPTGSAHTPFSGSRIPINKFLVSL